jgi:hypothetical protein
MKVNHLHLMVPDVPATSDFFAKYFELRKISGNAGLTVMLDDYVSAPGGFLVEIGA